MDNSWIYGGFHKWGYTKMDGFWKIPLGWMMIEGTPILGTAHMIYRNSLATLRNSWKNIGNM